RERRPMDRLFAAECEQLPREGGGPLRRGDDFLQVAADRLVGADLLGQELGVPQNRREHVVEVVSHAARELADGFHLLRLSKLVLEDRLRARTLTANLYFLSFTLDRRHETSQAAFDEKIAGARLERRDGGLLADRARDDDERKVEAAGPEHVQRVWRAEGRHAVVGEDDVPRAAGEGRRHRGGGVDPRRRDLVGLRE